MITRSHASPFIGQHIVCRTHEGAVHHGILHSVTAEGVYLRPLQGRTHLAAGSQQPSSAVTLNNAGTDELDVEQTWWPFFFLPFFALAWLGPWGWWW
ncbi:hypothetical protein [Alicyclobacillus sp. SO9]|uniref:hypothetical protein n=1 Tax=Alicyclobacillus sp. SO9 TaxID=2665646 RepID=UPI0018E7711A|nr:hypothetical protein [Alicyclobacillus sp. SO9]QQE80151.1 hypothetical protein GI364_06885 [Alicyclobacillus sp. SO9]